MIRGVVNASAEAIVRLRLRGPGGVEFEAVRVIKGASLFEQTALANLSRS